MTGKTFKYWVLATIACVLIPSVAASVAYYFGKMDAELLRAVPSILLPIGAAWLAYCWQRRVAFTKALFDVWQKIVVTVQDARQYTHLEKPSQEQFSKIMRDLSCRIDDIRGVFRNIREPHTGMSEATKEFIVTIKHSEGLDECSKQVKSYYSRNQRDVGVYPFESLKQMCSVVERLGFGDRVTLQRSKDARKTIDALWQILRGELLKELDRDFPQYPDTPYHS